MELYIILEYKTVNSTTGSSNLAHQKQPIYVKHIFEILYLDILDVHQTFRKIDLNVFLCEFGYSSLALVWLAFLVSGEFED